ncbi:MAG: hypothetical protein AAF494_13780 [Pseudomonadota bacterium]
MSIDTGIEHYNRGNFRKAFEAFEAVAVIEDQDVLCALAWMHEHGKGTSKNTQAAIDLYTKAEALGSVNASYQLGLLFTDSQSTEEAEKCFQRGARTGHAPSMCQLGVLLTNCENTQSARYKEGLGWLRKSTDAGSLRAQRALLSRQRAAEKRPTLKLWLSAKLLRTNVLAIIQIFKDVRSDRIS